MYITSIDLRLSLIDFIENLTKTSCSDEVACHYSRPFGTVLGLHTLRVCDALSTAPGSRC